MRFLLLVLVALAAGPGHAQTQLELAPVPAPEAAPGPGVVEVDVELLLLVDVSRSMTPHELEIQRRGYAEALTTPDVIDALVGGYLGRVALAYVEWAGSGSQRVIVDWRVVDGRDAARAFARDLRVAFNPGMRRTSISGALRYGAESLEGNGIDALRQVIDISGDGPNNQGGPVASARDAVVARGITVNGLPLMTREGMGAQWHLEDLDRYYTDCVIGGPGAFVVPVRDWAEFTPAIRRKLILELAGAAPRIVAAQYVPQSGADCEVGEKMWQRRRGIYDLP